MRINPALLGIRTDRFSAVVDRILTFGNCGCSSNAADGRTRGSIAVYLSFTRMLHGDIQAFLLLWQGVMKKGKYDQESACQECICQKLLNNRVPFYSLSDIILPFSFRISQKAKTNLKQGRIICKKTAETHHRSFSSDEYANEYN